jgi:tRNA(Ile)-lysidine synthase
VVKRDSTLKIGKDAAGGSLDSAAMPKALARDYHYVLNAPGVLPVEEAGVTLKLTEVSVADLPAYSEAGKDLAFFDKDRLQFPLVVRNVRSGDRFSPLGVKGSQKVKKYFIDHKIPVSRRRICPLLVCRDKIIWIAGHRIDNSVKIVPTTKRVLRAELLLA